MGGQTGRNQSAQTSMEGAGSEMMGLAHLPLLFNSAPFSSSSSSSPSLPYFEASLFIDCYEKQWLTVSHLHGNAALSSHVKFIYIARFFLRHHNRPNPVSNLNIRPAVWVIALITLHFCLRRLLLTCT